METTALQTLDAQNGNSTSDLQDYRPHTFEQAQRFCEVLAQSALVPNAYQGKPADVFVAIQYGAEVGLGPMQSLQHISVINGRPAMWGDAPLALVQGSGKLEWIKEWADGETAHCETKRRNYPAAHKTSFSQDDAKRMGLAGKQGPWQQCPGRMRQLRARGFNLRDQFSDVLKGIGIAEEIQDIIEIQGQPEVSVPDVPVDTKTKGDSVLSRMQKPTAHAAAPGGAPEAHQESTAESPGPGSAASGEVPSYNEQWLSEVMDCEDFLRGTTTGTNLLRSIRTDFSLADGQYPLLTEQQADYRSRLQQTVKRLEKRKA